MIEFILEMLSLALIIVASEWLEVSSEAVEILIGMALGLLFLAIGTRAAYLDAMRRQRWPGETKKPSSG
jgi:hypothetical protein